MRIRKAIAQPKINSGGDAHGRLQLAFAGTCHPQELETEGRTLNVLHPSLKSSQAVRKSSVKIGL